MVKESLDTPESKAVEIKSAVDTSWSTKGQEVNLSQTIKDRTLKLLQPLEFVYNKQNEVVGVEAWISLYDDKGNELPVDPHRKIVNPPLIHDGVRDPEVAIWAVLWDSVTNIPNQLKP